MADKFNASPGFFLGFSSNRNHDPKLGGLALALTMVDKDEIVVAWSAMVEAWLKQA